MTFNTYWDFWNVGAKRGADRQRRSWRYWDFYHVKAAGAAIYIYPIYILIYLLFRGQKNGLFPWFVALNYDKNVVSYDKIVVILRQKCGYITTKMWLITFI